MQAETRFKTKVLKKLKELGFDIFVMKIQQVAKVGDPDIVLCCGGRFVAWELKVGDNKATSLQQYKLDLITKAGGIARVVTPENLNECLEELCASCLSGQRPLSPPLQSQQKQPRRGPLR